MDNKELNERAEELQTVCEAIRKAVPKGANLKTAIDAAVFLIADCIIQAPFNEEDGEAYINRLPVKIRTAIQLLKEEES